MNEKNKDNPESSEQGSGGGADSGRHAEVVERSEYIRLLYDLVRKRDALNVAIHTLGIALDTGAITDPPERGVRTASRQSPTEAPDLAQGLQVIPEKDDPRSLE